MTQQLVVLDETNGHGLLPEASPAHHEAVLADEATRRAAHAALAAARAVLAGVGVLKVDHDCKSVSGCFCTSSLSPHSVHQF